MEDYGIIHTWLSLNKTGRDNEKVGFPSLIPGFSFRIGFEVRQQQNLDGWDFGSKPVLYR